MAQERHVITRRLLAVFLAAAFLNTRTILPASAAQETVNTWAQARGILERIRSRHAIDMGFEGLKALERPDIIFEEISMRDRKRLIAFLRVFEQELSKYPPGFFKNAFLVKVVFVKKLFYEGKPAQGIYRSAEGFMYFDIYRDFGNEGAQRHGIHHEFFHMVDVSLRRSAAAWSEGAGGDIYGWGALNDPAFKYEKEGRVHKGGNELNFFAPPKAGFATDYAFVSMAEDMAELYACLFIESENRLLHEWALKDKILAAKIEAMKSILEKFSPQINAQFWTGLF